MQQPPATPMHCPMTDSAVDQAHRLGRELNALDAEAKLMAEGIRVQPAKPVRELCRQVAALVAERGELEGHIQTTLALDTYNPQDMPEIEHIAQSRMEIGRVYGQACDLHDEVRRIWTSAAGNNHLDQVMAAIRALRATRSIIKELHKLIRAVPVLGETEAYWKTLTPKQIKGSRPSGRGKLPAEAGIALCNAKIARLMPAIIKASGGLLSSEAQVVASLPQTRKGRPKSTELARMDKRMEQLQDELARANAAPEAPAPAHTGAGRAPLTKQQQIESLERRIEALQTKIDALAGGLSDADHLARLLGMLRRKHGALVRQLSNGRQGDKELLLRIVQNEVDQDVMIAKIHDLDPGSTVTAGHRVNPKEARDRIGLLLQMLLSAPEKRLVDEACAEVKVLRAR